MPDPFISPQDFIDYTGRGGTADAGLVIVTDAACDIVREFAEIAINEVVGDVVVLDGSGTDTLLLPETPVNGAGTVTINGGTITSYVLGKGGMLFRTAGTVADTFPNSLFSAYQRPSFGLSPYSTPVWPRGRQNVAVTYDHGWADQDIPRSIRMVALAIAVRLAVQGPAIQEGIGTTTVRYGTNSTDLTDGEKAILRKYKQP